MLTPDAQRSIERVKSNTPEDARIFAHPSGLGWWIGGLVPRAWGSSWHTPLANYQQEHDDFLCAVNWRQGCDPYEFLDGHGYSYIIVDWNTWQLVANKPENAKAFTNEAPWLRQEADFGSVQIYAFEQREL